ncbi:MAG: phosphoglycerate mutase family protein [Rickettsiales bacterium]|jgi:probable phosphoglycerate mutase|nr:phosphoglycerate mutase family protein [Rickettsiales bacterium]
MKKNVERNMWYIFRHGETFFNKKNMRQGHVKNSFLTFEGAIQAHMNGLKLKKLRDNFDDFKFICTPLERTYQTIQLMGESLGIVPLTPIQDELIISRSRGKFEGHRPEDFEKLFPIEYKNVMDNPWSYEFEGYESYKNSYLRLAKFIKKYEKENLVVVAHKGVNRNMMFLLQKNKEINDLLGWINGLGDRDGSRVINELKASVPTFNQNYFYSWDGNEFIKY